MLQAIRRGAGYSGGKGIKELVGALLLIERADINMNLKELGIGESAVITAVGGEGALRQHFLDMGVIPGAKITTIKYAPLGDPVEYKIHGYELTLRLDDAARIDIKKIADKADDPGTDTDTVYEDEFTTESEHPGLGEGGRFQPKGTGNPLPDDTIRTFALVGNQNSGKTTLFNQLTGSKQHVGNFPGVTVDRKDGPIKGHPDTVVTDLPGICSMSPYSSEEIVSRIFVLNE